MTPEPITPALLRGWRLPDPQGSKYDRGRVLVLGGSRATPGAVLLAGLGALRVGAGKLGLGVPASVAPTLAVTVPEAGVRALPEDDDGTPTGALGPLAAQLERSDVVVVGPGLVEPEGTARLVAAVAREVPADTPVLLDAYALGVLPDLPDAVAALRGRLVLTPNLTEAARMLGEAEVSDPVQAATAVAERFGAVVSCGNVVVDGDRRWQATTGHAGLGTSGSGDVQAGAIAGLVARGADLGQAAVWGTHLHTSAGDALAARVGRVGFLARELLDELPRLLTQLEV